MLNKFKTKFASLAVLFMLALPVFIPVSASAEICPGGAASCPATTPTIQKSLCSGAGSLSVTNDEKDTCAKLNVDNSGESKINSIIKTVINLFSVIVGVVAVIMIIVGGFRYITSAGGSDKVKNAKNTILYALIGLIIVALAQVVVKYVLTKATQNPTT